LPLCRVLSARAISLSYGKTCAVALRFSLHRQNVGTRIKFHAYQVFDTGAFTSDVLKEKYNTNLIHVDWLLVVVFWNCYLPELDSSKNILLLPN